MLLWRFLENLKLLVLSRSQGTLNTFKSQRLEDSSHLRRGSKQCRIVTLSDENIYCLDKMMNNF